MSQWIKGSWHLEVVAYLDNICLLKQLNMSEKSGQAAANQKQGRSVYHVYTKGGVDKVRVFIAPSERWNTVHWSFFFNNRIDVSVYNAYLLWMEICLA